MILKARKQKSIHKSNIRENQKRIPHVYKEGDYVTLERKGIIPKLSFPRQGPYKVLKAHDNGTVTIETEPFVTDRVNIRRIHPYYGRDSPETES